MEWVRARAFLVVGLGWSLAMPLASGSPDVEPAEIGHQPLTLYGDLIDPITLDAQWGPTKPDEAWTSPAACALPDGLLVPPVTDCQHLSYVLKNGTRRDVPLMGTIPAKFFLSADFLLSPGVGSPLPLSDAGVAPLMNVEAALRIDGKAVAHETVQKTILTGIDGQPTPFDFELDPEGAVVKAGRAFSLDFRWWQVDVASTPTGQPFFNLQDGGDYVMTAHLMILAPVTAVHYSVERLDLAQLCDPLYDPVEAPHEVRWTLFQKVCAQTQARHVVAVQATVDSLFPNPRIDAQKFEVSLTGPGSAKTFLGPYNLTQANGLLLVGRAWDFEADNADPTQFTLKASLPLGEGAVYEQRIGLADLAPLETPSSLPGVGPIGLWVVLGLAATVLLRRRL